MAPKTRHNYREKNSLTAKSDNEVIIFDALPEDIEVLALIGEVSLRQSQHVYALKMVLRSLNDLIKAKF